MKKTTPKSQDANPEEIVTPPEAAQATQDSAKDGKTSQQPAPASDPTADALAELTNDLQRTRADFENFRKQTEVQKSQAMAAAKYATVTKFLPLVDDFSRAIEAYGDQLAPLRKSLDKTLQGLGLTMIESTPGTEFNPDYHEAISVEDDEGDTEIIAETLRPGYMYDGAVIRAAMVKVKHQ